MTRPQSEENANLARAKRLFEQGDFAASKAVLLQLERRGVLDDDALGILIELLRDSSEFKALEEVLFRAIQNRLAIDAPVSPNLAAERFGSLLQLQRPEREREGAAFDLLASAAAVGDYETWRANVLLRRHEIEETIRDPIALIDALVQMAMAPDSTGLPAIARARIEEIGYRVAESPDISRAAERALHALGDPEAGYRVEQARKRIRPSRADATRAVPRPFFTGLTIGLAGGFPALRSLIERDLLQSGAIAVRVIPSAKEAIRSGRDIKATVAGCDVVVLLVRQLAHSTEAQIKRASEQTGVPMLVAESNGVGGVQRALREHGVRQRSPGAELDSGKRGS